MSGFSAIRKLHHVESNRRLFAAAQNDNPKIAWMRDDTPMGMKCDDGPGIVSVA
jgi:hypothetical protein